MRSPRTALMALCVIVGLSSLVFVSASAPAAGLQIRTLSNRPDLISGGDALVRIDVPAGVAAKTVKVTVNTTDVTSAMRPDEASHTLTGLVTGLANGANSLAVTAPGAALAKLTIVNYPITGPIFHGPKEQPFLCGTPTFKVPGGTLGPALDADCSIATRVDYAYRSTAGGALKPLADPKVPPADVAQTTTSLGVTVPYIVRLETGTIDRSIYQIAMLHNPAKEPAPDFATKPAGWNGRLIYAFGGGCPGGWFQQGSSTGGVDDDAKLGKGYAVVSSSLNVAGTNCDELLSAEVTMMVKERFIEAYGVPKFTIGFGGSGGAYQQTVIAEAFPGLLDGLMPSSAFPEMQSLQVTSTDSRLLDHYFATVAKVSYTEAQKLAIAGYYSLANMMEMATQRAGRINPTEDCPDDLPSAMRYNAVSNPKGARCATYDHYVNALGRDPKTGFARRPLDNVGIQYGLSALNAGTISKEQFLDLNERIGGFDTDANMVPARSVADLEAVRNAYRHGIMVNGGGGLAAVPIVDMRTYLDDDPKGNNHILYHSYEMRARLMKANGHIDNHVLLITARGGRNVYPEALGQMDRWLTKLSEDVSMDAPVARLKRAKPADLLDACWTRDASPTKVVEHLSYQGAGQCEKLYPSGSFPRGVAGSPINADVMKCAVKPIDLSEYKVTFTAGESARLKQIFVGGVCDWSKPGVGQSVPVPWLAFDGKPAGAGTR